MTVLPDLLASGLDLVIVGTAAGRTSAERRPYYAGRGNRFWRVLHEIGLTPIELRPDDYAQLVDYGIGLTDFAKGAFGMDGDLLRSDFDRVRLRAVIKTASPRVLAFNGKTAAARFFNVSKSKINYGRQPGSIGRTAVYVCPSTSRRTNGHWSREPWQELARAIKELR
jgi:TDG/mug DNA glycosylase family protein